jgi:uncharacterized protein YjbI with pentapeptide repeats
MYRSLLTFLFVTALIPACSSASLRGKSASGGAAAQDIPLALYECKASAPAKLCGLSSLASNLQMIDSITSSQTLNGIRLASQNIPQQMLQDVTVNASCLSESSFIDGQWERTVFAGSEMILTEASRSSWRKARFTDSDLRLSHFSYANFSELTVKGSCLASSNWSASQFQDVMIEDSSADQGNFSSIKAQGSFAFIRGLLTATNFSLAVFEGPVDFQNSDLRGANLSGATFKDTVNWQGAQLSGAIWMDGRVCAEGSVGTCL